MYASAIFDIVTLIILNVLFLGTLEGMVIAMVSSAIISIWSWFFMKPKKMKKKEPKWKKDFKIILDLI
jgi:peptidoglycan biosynthesis protein MviN/MurJ (putative lipid II flippase)